MKLFRRFRIGFAAVLAVVAVSAATTAPTVGNAVSKKAKKQVKKRPVTNGPVVMFGDSITEFWNGHPDGFFPGTNLVNKGVSGNTVVNLQKRFEADVVKLKPSVVVFQIGINDLAETSTSEKTQQITSALSILVDASVAKGYRVVISSTLPVGYRKGGMEIFFARRSETNKAIVELNGRYKTLAAKKGAVYLDYYRVLVNADGELRDDYSADNVHLTWAGYNVMKPLVEAAVSAATK
jgi:lysophospholipase L1-like esterase